MLKIRRAQLKVLEGAALASFQDRLFRHLRKHPAFKTSGFDDSQLSHFTKETIDEALRSQLRSEREVAGFAVNKLKHVSEGSRSPNSI